MEMSNKAWDWSPEILQYTVASQHMDYSWLFSYNLSYVYSQQECSLCGKKKLYNFMS